MIDGVVNEAVVKLLANALPEGERLVVCGTGIDTEAREVLRGLRPGSTTRKIPSALLETYRAPTVLQRLAAVEESASDLETVDEEPANV